MGMPTFWHAYILVANQSSSIWHSMAWQVIWSFSFLSLYVSALDLSISRSGRTPFGQNTRNIDILGDLIATLTTNLYFNILITSSNKRKALQNYYLSRQNQKHDFYYIIWEQIWQGSKVKRRERKATPPPSSPIHASNSCACMAAQPSCQFKNGKNTWSLSCKSP